MGRRRISNTPAAYEGRREKKSPHKVQVAGGRPGTSLRKDGLDRLLVRKGASGTRPGNAKERRGGSYKNEGRDSNSTVCVVI